jgi:hypothetical protein
MVADLFEAGKESQNDATALDAFDFRPIKPFGQFVDRLLIERGLAACQRAKRGHLGFVRQIADDALVRFDAAQNVGPHQTAQRGELVLIFPRPAFDKHRKVLGPSQQAGAKEVK